jgi:hypothetical protein
MEVIIFFGTIVGLCIAGDVIFGVAEMVLRSRDKDKDKECEHCYVKKYKEDK